MGRALRSLYVSYLGLHDPLVETQVIAYLHGLVADGHVIHLLTYELGTRTRSDERRMRERLENEGIHWHRLRYHRTPSLPATAYDVARGVVLATRLIRRFDVDIFHARDHVPAAIGLVATRLTGASLVFDVRGLMAEEYVARGTWKRRSLKVPLTRAVQRRAVRRAAGVVVLTERARQFIAGGKTDAAIQVIPTCVDLSRFPPRSRRRGDGREGLVMAYVGKFGGAYLQRAMIEFFHAVLALDPAAHFLVLTQSDRVFVDGEFRSVGIPVGSYTIRSVPPGGVGPALQAAHFAIALIRPSGAMLAISLTKIGEYLAAGLPVVTTPGIGDTDALLTSANVGVLLDATSARGRQNALATVKELVNDPATDKRCKAAARQNLSLEHVGIPRYLELYREVGARIRNSARARA